MEPGARRLLLGTRSSELEARDSERHFGRPLFSLTWPQRPTCRSSSNQTESPEVKWATAAVQSLSGLLFHRPPELAGERWDSLNWARKRQSSSMRF